MIANDSLACGGSLGRVLIVDDDQLLARASGRLLKAARYDVEVVNDGLAAAALLAQGSFDVILSDIEMPQMTGLQLLKEVRARDLDVPVILITGSPDLQTAMEAVEHGALRYLTKPVDMAELLKVVKRAVSLNRLAKIKREALAFSGGGLGLVDRFALETSFERALGTLWMAFQPIVQVEGRSLFAYEALLRSEEKALPHPGAIIEAAERLGRAHELGGAIRAAASAAFEAAPAGVLLFVNLNASDLLDESLFSSVAPLSLIAPRVVLEITERDSMDRVKDVGSRIAALRSLGFRIAIDDLGAGYAGLTSFATLEPEVVKIDMSLVRDVDKTPTKAKLIRSITSLCAELGMRVVAEGVETREERDTLVELGCGLLQGFLLAKPARAFAGFTW